MEKSGICHLRSIRLRSGQVFDLLLSIFRFFCVNLRSSAVNGPFDTAQGMLIVNKHF